MDMCQKGVPQSVWYVAMWYGYEMYGTSLSMQLFVVGLVARLTFFAFNPFDSYRTTGAQEFKSLLGTYLVCPGISEL